MPRFNLIVLRVADLEQATCFYELLDFQFVKHAHGAGPQHYSAEANGVVFECILRPLISPYLLQRESDSLWIK